MINVNFDLYSLNIFSDLTPEEKNRRIIEKARNEEDEYDQKNKSQMESYYATAHKIKEKVVKQHSMLGGGDPDLQLKPYQVKLKINLFLNSIMEFS